MGKKRRSTLIVVLMLIIIIILVIDVVVRIPTSAPSTSPTSTQKPTATPKPTAASATKKMEVTISCVCRENNSVGQEWTTYFSVNGLRVDKDSSMEVSLGEKLTIFTEITELDDSANDVGTASNQITVTSDQIKTGFSVSQIVTVIENGGQYKGHTAIWAVEYTFIP